MYGSRALTLTADTQLLLSVTVICLHSLRTEGWVHMARTVQNAVAKKMKKENLNALMES